MIKLYTLKKSEVSPSWFGSVDRALICGLKGPGFDSSQGHMPEFQAQSPEGGVQEAADQFSLIIDVSISLPLSL
jgi:hypothetical protein